MKDRLKKSLLDRVNAGARPRRADPRYARPIVLTIPQAVRAILFLIIGGGILTLSAFALLGLRPASSADLRLAAIVRAAVPDVDALSQDDLVARLALPSQVSRLLSPLAATDPARAPIRASWLGALWNTQQPITTPERMRALGGLATALAALPEHDRTDLIGAVIALYEATRDPASRTLIAGVAALTRLQREALATSIAYRPLLAALADLPEEKREALSDGRLDLLPNDPDRLRLVQSIPKLDPTAVRLINRLADINDFKLRQALIYVVEQITSGNSDVIRLITAYYCHETSLMAALALPSPGICRKPSHDR